MSLRGRRRPNARGTSTAASPLVKVEDCAAMSLDAIDREAFGQLFAELRYDALMTMSDDDLRAKLDELFGAVDDVAKPPSTPPQRLNDWIAGNLARDASGEYELSPTAGRGSALGQLDQLLREDEGIARWIGDDLAAYLREEDPTLVWRDGFVRTAFIGSDQSGLDAATVIESIAATPAARGIENLAICGALDDVPD